MAAEVDGCGSQRRWRSRGRRSNSSLMDLPESVVDDSHERHWVGRRYISLECDTGEEAGDAETESTPSVMINSFHSEGGGRGRGRGKHVSWTQESPARDGGAGQGQSSDDVEPLNTSPSRVRGRQLGRPSGFDSPIVTEAPLSETDSPRARRGSTASAVSAAASRRSASIVFLAMFGLFGFSSHLGVQRSSGPEGRVLSIPPRGVVFIPDDMSWSTPLAHATPLSFVTTSDSGVQLNDIFEFSSSDNEDTQRLIGRVSAWTCTTLYVTSRLPQIWKNVRKSPLFVISHSQHIFPVVCSQVCGGNVIVPDTNRSMLIIGNCCFIGSIDVSFHICLLRQFFLCAVNPYKSQDGLTRAACKTVHT